MEPKVRICCITYKHAKYICDAIDGFLIQKTNFAFEILIHDDASTDRTDDIIKEYENEYSDLIFTSYQKEKGVRPINKFNFERVRGKCIALCEGDDYWTEPLKLQKQAYFLEANEDCSLCFHAAELVYANNLKNCIHRPKRIPKDFKFETKHAILGGGDFMATNSTDNFTAKW